MFALLENRITAILKNKRKKKYMVCVIIPYYHSQTSLSQSISLTLHYPEIIQTNHVHTRGIGNAQAVHFFSPWNAPNSQLP